MGTATGYNNSNLLGIDFDQPGNTSKSTMGDKTPLPMEYMPVNGDSGGGLFITDAGVQKLAGVVSFGAAPLDGVFNGNYGDTSFFTRVSQLNGWIDDQMTAADWTNSAGGSFNSAVNWDTASVPNSANIAVFNVAGSYAVSFGGDVSNKRMRIRQGNVTFDLGGSTYTLGSSTLETSLAVARRI